MGGEGVGGNGEWGMGNAECGMQNAECGVGRAWGTRNLRAEPLEWGGRMSDVGCRMSDVGSGEWEGGVESGRIGREGTSPHRRLRRHLPRGGRLPERARGAGCLAELLALGGVFERADAAEGRAGSAVGVDGGATGSGAVAEGGSELGEGGVFEEEVAAAGAGEVGGDARAREITKRVEIPDAGNKEPARRAACFGDIVEGQEERGWGRRRHIVSILFGFRKGKGMSEVGSGKWGVGSGKWDVGCRMSDVGRGMWEGGCGKGDVGRGMWEGGRGNGEGGRWTVEPEDL